MIAVFVSSYRSAESFFNSKNKLKFDYVVTDKISVKNYFEDNNIDCFLLSNFIDEKKYINLFKKEYLNFNKLLIKSGRFKWLGP